MKLNIPSGWESATVKDIAEKVTAGGTPSTTKSEYWENGSIPWMSSGEIHLKRVTRVEKNITELGLKSSSAKLIPPKSVLIALAGQGKTRGTVAISEMELTTNQSLAAVITNEKIVPDYLYFNLNNRYAELRSYSTGDGGRGGLNLNIIKDIPVIYPKDTKEQIKILEILSEIEKRGDLLNCYLNEKKELKKFYVQKLLYPNSETRGEVSWSDKKMEDCVKFSGGAQPPRSTFINEPQEGYIRLIQIRDYKTDKYLTYIPENLARKFCTKEDVMIGRYGPPIFQILRGIEGAYNVALMKAIPLEGVDREYMYHFLSQPKIERYLDSFSQRSAGQAGIEMDMLLSYPFPLPDLNYQQRVASLLNKFEEEINYLELLLEKNKILLKGMMQQLLTGNKRVC